MMKEANINIVRLAEFAWAKLEPLKGQYDFSWLDEAIDTLSQEGIRVVIGTPTASTRTYSRRTNSAVTMVLAVDVITAIIILYINHYNYKYHLKIYQ